MSKSDDQQRKTVQPIEIRDTGRDAADTAFLDNHNGAITLDKLLVSAVVDGDLPRDSIDELVSIG
jgi:hypothetical protein